MNPRFYISFLAILLFSSASAQKDGGKTPEAPYKRSVVIKTYRGYMKDKNYDKARTTMSEAISKYPSAASDPQFYKYEIDALNELIGIENKKIYLQSGADTVKYFGYIYNLYDRGLKCDSVEQAFVAERLSMGKKTEPKLRSGVGQTMLSYRKNLIGAGKFYYRKKDYANAFRFIDMYCSTKTANVFLDSKGSSLLSDPDNAIEESVLAVLSAYGSGNYKKVMTYLPESLNDKNLDCQLLEIGSKAAQELGDSVEMVNLLENGFYAYPKTEYFFVTLTKYYNDHGEYDKALEKVLKMTELNPGRRDYWYMAGKEQMLLGEYADALNSFEKCVEIQADDAESHSAIGNIYLHNAHEAYSQFNAPLTDPSYSTKKQAITALYKQSCTAFEKARKFDENNTELWLPGLREVYFKLNRGRELKALEKYK